jgi:DNA-binding PadR family transcriptional regulator
MTFPTGKERVVLELLRDSSHGMYGLELVDASGGRLRRGSIYVTLGRMLDKGFVTARVLDSVRGQPGLPRPQYKITALGQRALKAVALMAPGHGPRPALQEA